MNPSDFPDDDTGDALRRLLSHGDRFDVPRDIDFTVVFPAEQAALAFANHFEQAGLKVSITNSSVNEDRPWDVLVVKNMTLTYEAITDFEHALQAIADALGGENDGWGCIAQNDAPPN